MNITTKWPCLIDSRKLNTNMDTLPAQLFFGLYGSLMLPILLPTMSAIPIQWEALKNCKSSIILFEMFN